MNIFIMGQVGAGKTLLATILATSIVKNETIYANYVIIHKNYQKFQIEEFLSKKYQNGIIIMDEVYNYLESRFSMYKQITDLTHTLFQIRKMGLHSISTAPLVKSIDVRLREMIDILIYAEKKENWFEYSFYFKKGMGGVFEFSQTKIIELEKAKNFYNLYNTLEIVEDSILTVDYEKELLELAKTYVDSALFYFQDKKLTHFALKRYLLENNLNKQTEKLLYELIKEGKSEND